MCLFTITVIYIGWLIFYEYFSFSNWTFNFWLILYKRNTEENLKVVTIKTLEKQNIVLFFLNMASFTFQLKFNNELSALYKTYTQFQIFFFVHRSLVEGTFFVVKYFSLANYFIHILKYFVVDAHKNCIQASSVILIGNIYFLIWKVFFLFLVIFILTIFIFIFLPSRHLVYFCIFLFRFLKVILKWLWNIKLFSLLFFIQNQHSQQQWTEVIYMDYYLNALHWGYIFCLANCH